MNLISADETILGAACDIKKSFSLDKKISFYYWLEAYWSVQTEVDGIIKTGIVLGIRNGLDEI